MGICSGIPRVSAVFPRRVLICGVESATYAQAVASIGLLREPSDGLGDFNLGCGRFLPSLDGGAVWGDGSGVPASELKSATLGPLRTVSPMFFASIARLGELVPAPPVSFGLELGSSRVLFRPCGRRRTIGAP